MNFEQRAEGIVATIGDLFPNGIIARKRQLIVEITAALKETFTDGLAMDTHPDHGETMEIDESNLNDEDRAHIKGVQRQFMLSYGSGAAIQAQAPIPPVTKVTCSRDRLRAVFYAKDEAITDETTTPRLEQAFNRWLDGGSLVLVGIDRMELYEMSRPMAPMEETEFEKAWQDVVENVAATPAHATCELSTTELRVGDVVECIEGISGMIGLGEQCLIQEVSERGVRVKGCLWRPEMFRRVSSETNRPASIPSYTAEFRVGDIVECVKGLTGLMNVGERQEVAELDACGSVRLHNGSLFWAPNRFRLIHRGPSQGKSGLTEGMGTLGDNASRGVHVPCTSSQENPWRGIVPQLHEPESDQPSAVVCEEPECMVDMSKLQSRQSFQYGGMQCEELVFTNWNDGSDLLLWCLIPFEKMRLDGTVDNPLWHVLYQSGSADARRTSRHQVCVEFNRHHKLKVQSREQISVCLGLEKVFAHRQK